jgi:hypothetical protein
VTGGFTAAFVAFVVAAVVVVAQMFTAAFVVSRAKDATVQRIQASAAGVKKWGGAILLIVGVWFVSLAAFADFFARVFPV